VKGEIVMLQNTLLSLKIFFSPMISFLTCVSKTLNIVPEALFVLEKEIHY